NSAGTSGYLLQSTGSGTKWINPASLSISDGDWVVSGSNMYSGVSGNVGIGTSSPAQKLDVNGTILARNNLVVGQTSLSGYRSVTADGNDLIVNGQFAAGGTAGSAIYKLGIGYGPPSTGEGSLNVAGNVGIGTTSPLEKLHVAGNIRGDGGISVQNRGGDSFHGPDTTYDVIHAASDTSDYYIALQDGNDRVHHYWNAVPGSQKYIVSGEPAVWFMMGTTGIQFRTAPAGTAGNTISWRNGLNIDTSGNVGIGTSAPSQKLHVSGNLRVTGAYYDSSNTSGSNGQVLTSTGSGTKWVNPASISDGDWVVAGSNMYAGVSGNVGIGTASPAQKLHVSGGDLRVGDVTNVRVQIHSTGSGNSGYSNLYLTNAATGSGNAQIWKYAAGATSWGGSASLNIYNSNGPIAFHPANRANAMFIAANGAIGMGTTSPTQKLHVVGNIRVTGAYYDSSNAAGTNGQILQSTGSGTKWVNPGTLSGSYILNQFSSAQAANFYIAGQGRINSNLAVMSRVGIGTATPANALDVRDTTGTGVTFGLS
ncbi:MAG: hypothetical protein D6795_04895, partial [Deltaproteobacteria bacterium]